MTPWTATSIQTLGGAPPPSAASFKAHRIAIASNIQSPSIATSAGRDQFILLQRWRTDLRDQARAANPNCKILMYQNISRLSTPDGSGNFSSILPNAAPYAATYSSGIADADAGVIAKIDVTSYKTDCKNALLDGRLNGWDGVFLDDMNAISDGYGTNAQWQGWQQTNNQTIGPGLTAAGKMGIPNMSGTIGEWNLNSGGWLENQFQYYDGGLDEFFARWPNDLDLPQSYMDEGFAVMGRQAAAGKYYLAQLTTGTEAQALFACCCCLLQQSANTVSFYKTNSSDYGSEIWYANVQDKANALGVATGAKFSIGTKQWRRNFANGFVTANLTTRGGTIT